MEEILGALGGMLFLAVILGWLVSGYLGAAWLMYKGYTMEMLGCLGLFYGAPLLLMGIFGPLILLFAWGLPSRTDPTQQGGVKKVLAPKPTRKSLPSAPARISAPPKRPAVRAPVSRRPKVSGGAGRKSIPPSRPKPPPRRG